MISSDLQTKAQFASYIHAAMSQAQYEELADGEGIYAEIPGFRGVWANSPTFDECQMELADTLRDWIELSLSEGLAI